MASPEVERPMTSPSNPVLSPHGLSPGGPVTSAVGSATLPSPSNNTSRKVVTFDQCLEPTELCDREPSINIEGNTGYYSKAKFGQHGQSASGGGNQRHPSYYHKYRQSGPRASHIATSSVGSYTAILPNKEDGKNVLTVSGEKLPSKQLPSGGSGTQTHTIAQAKRFRGGGSSLRKRSYSFSEGKYIYPHSQLH